MKSLVFIHSNNMTLFYEDTLVDLFNWREEPVFWH